MIWRNALDPILREKKIRILNGIRKLLLTTYTTNREKTRKHNNFKRDCPGVTGFMEIIFVALNNTFL